MEKRLILILCFVTNPVGAQVTLAADSDPVEKPWKSPATLAYVRNGDGGSKATIDAYLGYQFASRKPLLGADGTTMADRWSAGAFIHRDNSSDTPSNDRGVLLRYSRLFVQDFSNAGPPMSVLLKAEITAGKTLEKADGTPAAVTYTDHTKDRQRLSVYGFVQPTRAGIPPVLAAPGKTPAFPFDMYFNWELGLYSDHSSGGEGTTRGRLSGSIAGLEWNVFPFGLSAENLRVGTLGVSPILTLSSQWERDSSASGTRTKDIYRLHTAALTLEFDPAAQLSGSAKDAGKLKPSIVLSRSVGSDLLSGRQYQGKTKISFGLSFSP